MTDIGRYFVVALLLLTTSVHADTVRVGYVSGGLYEQFVMQKLVGITVGNTTLKLVETQGSRDQMEKQDQRAIRRMGSTATPLDVTQ